MTTQFNDWLAECAAARKGGPTFKVVGSRGLVVKFTLRLTGDWTGYVMAARLKASPAAPTDLVAFAAVAPVVAVEAGVTVTRFRFTLSGAASGALPADLDLDGITQAALLVSMTPPGGDADLFAGGRFVLLGN